MTFQSRMFTYMSWALPTPVIYLAMWHSQSGSWLMWLNGYMRCHESMWPIRDMSLRSEVDLFRKCTYDSNQYRFAPTLIPHILFPNIWLRSASAKSLLQFTLVELVREFWNRKSFVSCLSSLFLLIWWLKKWDLSSNIKQ